MERAKRPLRFSLAVLSGILLVWLGASRVYAEHDTSLRTDLNFSYTVNDRFRAVSYVFLQADDDITNYDYVEWGVGLRYQTPLPWLSFLVYYQHGYAKDEDRHWSVEQKPSLNLNLTAPFFAFRIFNQIRYEHRITEDWNDFRIKNTLEISLPGRMVEPSIGWELFYENSDKAVMLNRIKFGVSRDIGKHISLGPYYRVDFSNIDSRWQWTRQLIGLQMTLKY